MPHIEPGKMSKGSQEENAIVHEVLAAMRQYDEQLFDIVSQLPRPLAVELKALLLDMQMGLIEARFRAGMQTETNAMPDDEPSIAELKALWD